MSFFVVVVFIDEEEDGGVDRPRKSHGLPPFPVVLLVVVVEVEVD